MRFTASSNAFETVTSDTGILTVLVPPRIVDQPLAQAVTIGGTFSVEVVASGSEPLRYQSKRDSVMLGSETNASLTITDVQASHAGSYAVIVTNLPGKVTSDRSRAWPAPGLHQAPRA